MSSGKSTSLRASRLGLAAWAAFVLRHRWAVALLSLAIGLALAAQLSDLKIDGSDEAFLAPDDPVRITYDAFRARFGRDGVIAMAIGPADVFEPSFLRRLEALHRALEREVPNVHDVSSLINARNTYGRGDELVVEDLLEEWPRNAKGYTALAERARSSPLYRNHLISTDGRVTTVLVELDTWSHLGTAADPLAGFDPSVAEGEEIAESLSFLTGDEIMASARALSRVVDRYSAPDFEIHVAGGPMAEARLMSAMQRDIALSVTASILVIATLLLLLFRRIVGVAMPLLVVSLALLSTLGLMAATGVTITLPIQVLPSFLLAVGVCDSVHVLMLFERALVDGCNRQEAIVRALDESGLAIVMTSITTAAGLASFASADLTPVRHFGIFGPAGVLFALFFTLTLLPALLAILPLREGKRGPRASPRWIERCLQGCGGLAARRPWAVVMGAGGLILFALVGASRLHFTHHPFTWLPDDDPTRRGVAFFDRTFRGSGVLEVLVETEEENGLHDPELLVRLDQLAEEVGLLSRGAVQVGKTFSLADVLKEIHQALHENRPEYYAIPDDPLLIAQEFLLFENTGSDDLEDVVDSQFRLTSFTLKIPEADAVEIAPFVDEVEARFGAVLGESARASVTGGSAISCRTFAAVIPSMARSYAVAFLAVTPLMILLMRSFRVGLISMIPNLTPVILTLGLMGWLGLGIDISTMMIGAVILGLAVDDTIHFMHGVQRNSHSTSSLEAAIRKTLDTTGRAMLFTSIVLSLGFLVYAVCTMSNLVVTGVLSAFAIAVAFLADVLLAPALLVLNQSGAPAVVDKSSGGAAPSTHASSE